MRLRKEFETKYPGQPLEYDRIKSTMLVRYHLPETADEMRDAWAALKQKQEETMRDFLIKVDSQVDLLSSKGGTCTCSYKYQTLLLEDTTLGRNIY